MASAATAGGGGGGHQQSIQIRVLAASTGVCYPISLHPNELTVANIKRHLAGTVPPSDQILLLGPPYKVPKDASLRSEEVLSALRLGDREDESFFSRVRKPAADATEDEGGGGGGGGGIVGGGLGGGLGGGGLLGGTERSGAKRLFLFSKRALSENAPDLPPCVLEHSGDLVLPSEPDPSPVAFPRGGDASAGLPSAPLSPLHQALEVYERRFMLDLCRGRAFADGSDLRLQSCRSCLSERAVMARALRAAVSNLSDHRNGAARTRTEFASTFQVRTAAHGELLRRFEACLGSLGESALHPALVSVARQSGRVMETLLDTVPVERERAWAAQCRTAHARLQSLYADLEGAFATQIGTVASREEEARSDQEAESEIDALAEEIETTGASIRDRQAVRLGRLTSNHGEVVRVITNAISEGNDGNGGGAAAGGSGGGSAQAAFASLEEMAKSSADILPSMEADDAALRDLMSKVAASKTAATKRMKARLRQVSVAQSAIQRVLSNVAVVRDALAQQCENMVHLEHVAELPQSYRDFLSEVRRRRAFGDAVLSASEAVTERLGTMRSDETRSRERFLRGPGRHLMPAFFEIFAPTLTAPPPLFAPQFPPLVEMDSLPDFGPPEGREEGTGAGAGAGGGASLGSNAPANENESPIRRPISTEEGQAVGVSSASTLTDGSQPPSSSAQGGAGSGGAAAGAGEEAQPRHAPTTGDKRAQGGGGQQASAPEQLIVSADENDNDVIMDTACTEDVVGGANKAAAAADAERKTLAYENAVLRQAIERMGGKAPRKYLDEAAAADAERGREEEAERREARERAAAAEAGAEAARRELEAVRGKLEAAERELGEANSKLAEAEKSGKGDDDAGGAAAAKKKKEPLSDKISFASFDVGDIGLFMPTGLVLKGGKRTYLAFHSNCPHRYLSTDNIEGTPDYVLGRIIYQEELYAGPLGTDSNPYGLHVGTKFWVLTVETLRVP